MQKKSVDKLVDECTETIEEVKLAKITLAENENSHKCSSCTLYTVVFWVFFTIFTGITIYFVYWIGLLLKIVLFLKRQTWSQKFWCKLVTNWQKKDYSEIDLYYIGYGNAKKNC